MCPGEIRDLKWRENHRVQPHSNITVFEEKNPSSNNSTCEGFFRMIKNQFFSYYCSVLPLINTIDHYYYLISPLCVRWFDPVD